MVRCLGLHKLYAFVFHSMLLRVNIRKGLSVYRWHVKPDRLLCGRLSWEAVETDGFRQGQAKV